MKNVFIFILCMGSLSLHAQIAGTDIYTGPGSITTCVSGTVSTAGSSWVTDRSTNYGAFVFIGTASVNSADDAHNVDGYVRHRATAAAQTFTYPVGTGADLRALTTGGAAKPADFNVAVAWNVTADMSTMPGSTPGAGISSVYPRGYWDWKVESGATAGTEVTVSIPDIATLFPAQLAADLRLVGWNGSEWIALGTAGSASTAENNLLAGTIPTGGGSISAITIGSVSTALPISLLSFSGTANGCDAVLKWTTAKEDNFSNFEVEWSKDGKLFYKVGTVAGGRKEYAFIYAQQSGLGIYRLKMNDRDGSYTYSDKVRVWTECKQDQINVYPNPVTDRLMVNGLPENVSVRIYDAAGRALLQRNGSSALELDMHLFAAGTYFLVIEQNHKIILAKELVKK